MTLDLKTKIGIAVGALVLAFASGYYLAPEKIKTEIKTVTVETKSDDKKTEENKDTHKEVVVTETQAPDGTKTTVTKTTEDTKVKDKSEDIKKDDLTVTKDKTTEITKSGRRINIEALVGMNLFNGITNITPVYGAHMSTNVVGPVTAGLFGFTNGILGVSIGIGF